MTDRIPGAPGQCKGTVTGGEFEKMRAGEPFVITLCRDDQPIQEGTPYSKAAVLPDAVAQVLCPELADPSPADAFRSLSQGTLPVIMATPQTLTQVIATARAGTTVQLKAGAYGLLELKGIHAYPEGLTIIGGSGVTMAGISITSGVKDQEIATPYPGNSKYDCDNADVSNAIMPRGLTVKDLAFTDSFSLRNCGIEDLSIIGCSFAEGAYLKIEPNTMYDCYGGDYTNPGSHAFETRRSYARVMAKNVVIRECTFTNVPESTRAGSTGCAIRVLGVDGITVYKNTVKRASFNGVNIGGVSGEELGIYSTGKISVTNNVISNTGDRSIRLFDLVDADVFVTANNLYAADVEAKDGYIAATDCINTVFNWGNKTSGNRFRLNKYSDNAISAGNGIVAERSCVADVVQQDSWTCEQMEGEPGTGHYRKLGTGLAAANGTFRCYVSDRLPEVNGPGDYRFISTIAFPFRFVLPPVVSVILNDIDGFGLSEFKVTGVTETAVEIEAKSTSSRDVYADVTVSAAGMWV